MSSSSPRPPASAAVADDIRSAAIDGGCRCAGIRRGGRVPVGRRRAARGRARHPGSRSQGVTVLGAGLEPRLPVRLAFVLTLTGVHALPHRIEVTRVVDVSAFGPAVRDRLGLGIPLAEFERRTGIGATGRARRVPAVDGARRGNARRLDSTASRRLSAHSPAPTARPPASSRSTPRSFATCRGSSPPSRASRPRRCRDLDPADRIEIRSDAGRTTTVLEGGVPSLPGAVAVIANSVHRLRDARLGLAHRRAALPAHPHGGASGERARRGPRRPRGGRDRCWRAESAPQSPALVAAEGGVVVAVDLPGPGLDAVGHDARRASPRPPGRPRAAGADRRVGRAGAFAFLTGSPAWCTPPRTWSARRWRR